MCSVYPCKVFACYSQAVCYVALLTAVGDAAILERYGRSNMACYRHSSRRLKVPVIGGPVTGCANKFSHSIYLHKKDSIILDLTIGRWELAARYDARQSFYRKAFYRVESVASLPDTEVLVTLTSYGTDVAVATVDVDEDCVVVTDDGTPLVWLCADEDDYSATTVPSCAGVPEAA